MSPQQQTTHMHEVNKLKVFSMFAGIGGLDLGFEQTGYFQTILFSEIEEYANKILAKHWPNTPNLGDCRLINYTDPSFPTNIDVIAAAFPCQDISVAGKQKGIKHGTRSSLWSEVIRAARSIRPEYIVLENVAAIVTSNRGADIRRVCGDLAALGYDSEWAIVRASDIGAPHQRARWFCIAWKKLGNTEHLRHTPTEKPIRDGQTNGISPERPHQSSEPKRTSSSTQIQELADPNNQGSQRHREPIQPTREKHTPPSRIFHNPKRSSFWNSGVRNVDGRLVEPSILLLAHGVPERVSRIKALGNAIVPQVAEHVGECLKKFDKERKANAKL